MHFDYICINTIFRNLDHMMRWWPLMVFNLNFFRGHHTDGIYNSRYIYCNIEHLMQRDDRGSVIIIMIRRHTVRSRSRSKLCKTSCFFFNVVYNWVRYAGCGPNWVWRYLGKYSEVCRAFVWRWWYMTLAHVLRYTIWKARAREHHRRCVWWARMRQSWLIVFVEMLFNKRRWRGELQKCFYYILRTQWLKDSCKA